jgi:hypothetical protein
MAARAKKSRRKSGGKAASKRSVSKRASAKRSGKKGSSAKRGASKKSAKRPAIKKSAAKRPAIKKAAAKRSGSEKRSASGGQKATPSPMARVTRVAKEVAQQASTAVTEGFETVKEFGGSIVDRVTS